MLKAKVPLKTMTVVAPDTGSISRNTFFANSLGIPLAMIYKERDYSKISTSASNNNIISTKLIGEIDHNDLMICDDMIDTGGTILKAARFLKEIAHSDSYIVCSLPFFNDPAIPEFDKAFEEGSIKGVFGTNAVYNPELWKRPWFFKVNVADLFADVIFRINEKISLSELLDGIEEINNLFKVED
jgi:ribose-phosphate pyrophosphokinase